jgi:hypothetical protein
MLGLLKVIGAVIITIIIIPILLVAAGLNKASEKVALDAISILGKCFEWGDVR